ncbi:MAG: protein-glutamate O-methyltransferase CheR [Gammaproteobacteria bacterium]|nr:protein-glutamate O-methyltransferase CheR [Gammaproteobacteria bacterium]MCB1881143.1 protein-glutamate O-methyltransferase CheR [Gammaproteobacteria bacterium]
MQSKTREFEFTRRDFDFLRKVSNSRTGIVVSDDKFDMFYSRLSRRVRLLGLKDFSEYCDLISNETEEREVLELVNALTTNLTAFFRENHHFEYLTHTLVPEFLQRNRESRRLRIWSAGCSTGEEPYSLSIALRESLPETGGWDVRILATDIDSAVLAKAADAIYPIERVAGVEQGRLRRWFQRGRGARSGMVRLKPEIKSLIEFHQLNLIQEWAMSEPMDAIFCRNVMIYFDKKTKAKLVERYANTLCDGGYLFIGHSESLFNLTDCFELIGNTVYRKRA